ADSQTAYNEDYAPTDPYDSEPLRTEALPPQDEIETANETPAPAPAATRRAAPARTEVPEETIGITPVTASTDDSVGDGDGDGDDIVVSAPRRPVWSRTPSARRLSALYPQQQLDRRRE